MEVRENGGDSMELELNDHFYIGALESAALIPDAWEIWFDQAEKLAGHSLDGDEFSGADTYSVDGAYDAWEAGLTPAEYVASI